MLEKHIIIDWICFFTPEIIKKYLHKYELEFIDLYKHPTLQNKHETISKFYKQNINDFRGSTPFNIYIVNDHNPIYRLRLTSKGNRLVNVKLFDFKIELRQLTTGCKIHSTDNIQETKDNLKCLNLFDKYYTQLKFKNLSEVFDKLNSDNSLQWIIMRNFEQIPNNILINKHLEIDLLVNDYYLIKRLLDANNYCELNTFEDGHYRILNYVFINNTKVLFNFRYVGDNYYDINLQKNMLESRILHNNFYIPNNENHLYSLIYHVIFHTKTISNTYINVFIKYGLNINLVNKLELRKLLDIFITKNNYKYVKPEPSVGFFI